MYRYPDSLSLTMVSGSVVCKRHLVIAACMVSLCENAVQCLTVCVHHKQYYSFAVELSELLVICTLH